MTTRTEQAEHRCPLCGHGTQTAIEPEITIGDCVINFADWLVTRQGKRIRLTRMEFDLLVFMARHKGLPLTRTQIVNGVWGLDYEGLTNIVDVYIHYLRRKICPEIIETVNGMGYQLGG